MSGKVSFRVDVLALTMSATDWFDVVGETYRNSPSASFIGSFPITKKFIATAEMEETRSPRVYHASHQLIGTLNHLISPLVQLGH